MSFFDELGKRISQAGQNAMQKTKDFSDITKLNSNISAEERKMNNAIGRLGRAYFEKHSEDYETLFEPIILEIKEAQNTIMSLRQQIQDIKKVAICEKCGAEISNNAAFCSGCGAPVTKKAMPEAPGEVMCPGCGQYVPADCKYCVICGIPMNVEPTAVPEYQSQYTPQQEQPIQYASQDTYVQQPGYESAPASADVSYEEAPAEQSVEVQEEVSYEIPVVTAPRLCANCNAEILPDMAFCTNCGTKVE